MEGAKPGVRIRERAGSLYDNLGDEEVGGRSMAPAMTTTVPQNMAAPKIEGRHHPTRTSLRHSRMIVMTNQGKVPRKYLPRVVRRHRLAKSLLALKLLMGVGVTTIAGWLLIWAPNLPTQDIPYWSGIPVLVSSIVGLILVCSCRKEYPGMPLACYVFCFKVFSVVCAGWAGVSCWCASAFAGLHLWRLGVLSCSPPHLLDPPCLCSSGSSLILHYEDLNCPEVRNVLSVLLIASAAANSIAALLSSWYLYLHWSSRYSYLYSRVRTNDNRPIIITNNI